MSRMPEDEFKDVIAELRRTAPEPPPVHWGAYRAELREKLERDPRAPEYLFTVRGVGYRFRDSDRD